MPLLDGLHWPISFLPSGLLGYELNIHFFSPCYDQMPGKKKQLKERFLLDHNLRNTVEKARQQPIEAAGHCLCQGAERAMLALSLLIFI